MVSAVGDFIQLNVIPPLKSLSEKIVELARCVFEAVRRVFAYLAKNFPGEALQEGAIETFKFLFCIYEPRPAAAEIRLNNVGLQQWNQRQPYPRHDYYRPAPLHYEPPLIKLPKIEDRPVDLDSIKNAIRNGEEVTSLSSRMNADDFIALCKDYPVGYKIQQNGALIKEGKADSTQEVHAIFYEEKRERGNLQLQIEFPRQRIEIGNLAKRWAEERIVKTDPTSPFYEIIQLAVARHERNNRTQAYELPKDQYYYNNSSRSLYTIYSLIGFQELFKHKELFYLLDNCSFSYDANLAYPFATALSRIYTYPKAGGIKDIRHKLQNGIGAVQEAYGSGESSKLR